MDTKKLRIKLTYLCGIMYFIGVQLVEAADTGQKATVFEGLAVGLLAFGLLYAGFSDWLFDRLADDGIKINYNAYQEMGLGVVVLFIGTIIAVVYNDLFDGSLGIYNAGFYILVGSLYLFVKLITFMGKKQSTEKCDE